MAIIKITRFGGLAPSVDARNLPNEGAQTAHNLNLRYGDFRPLKGPGASVAAVPALTKSIFRTPSGVWLSSTDDVDYVNGQINDAASERVYLTGRSAYPEAWQGGAYRRLGVPKPATAPTVTLSAVDQYGAADATADQAAATALVLEQVTANEASILLGAAPPVGIGAANPTPDPIYSQVALHLRFTELVGGLFVDSSPQNKLITSDASVTLGVDALGPLGVPGAGYANFAGGVAAGISFSGVNYDRTQPWTVDLWVKPAAAFQYIVIRASRGLVRKVHLETAAGARKALWSEYGFTLSDDSIQLQCKRIDGSDICAANTPVLISVQNTGSQVQVFIDGVYAGATPRSEGLRLSALGFSSWDDASWGFAGKMDEVRATANTRYDTAMPPASFAPPAGPYPDGSVPIGFWLLHGDPLCPDLPTIAAGDAAYLVPMTLVGGAYVTTNATDAYLMQGAMGGAQVTYSGNVYWAVPVSGYQAPSKSINQANLDTGLAAIVNPAAPPAKLLTAGQATALAASVAALYNTYLDPVLAYVTALNSRQSELREGIVTGNPTGNAAAASATLKNLVGLLEAQSDALTAYFAGISGGVTALLVQDYSSIFGAINSLVVQQLFEDRAYIATFVTDWGEESAPSAPSALLNLDQNDAAAVVVAPPTPGRNIVGWRLYRSSSTNSGADFQLVEDKGADNAVLLDGAFNYFSLAKLTYTDAKRQAELQESCPSLTWEEPDARMIGLVGMPNGIMAGFFGKTLCLSVPFEPYAWPIEYQQSLEFDIVGLGVFGQTLVVVTKGSPYFASGADSASMSAQKIESPQAGIAKRTIAAVEGGVMYASPDGLCLATPSGVSLVTVAAFSREDWQAAVTSAAFGAFHEGVYYLFTA